MLDRPKTILCDIDGTLIKHHGTLTDQLVKVPEILPGVLEKLNEWDRKGYRIILVTGRKESMRIQTENQLKSLGIFYDQIIMGVTNGVRVIINDSKPMGECSVESICVERNSGLANVDV